MFFAQRLLKTFLGASVKPAKPRAAARFRLTMTALESRDVPAGELATDFSGDGKATTAFNQGQSNQDFGNAVAVDIQGRTVVVGAVQQTASGDWDFGVTRFKSDGTVDTTFSGDGKATVAFDEGGSNNDRPFGVTTDEFNRIIVVGYAARTGAGDFDFAVTRLTSSGALDTSFNGDGTLVVPFGVLNDQATSVAIDGKGRIVIGGYTQQSTTGDNDFAVLRLTKSGNVDTNFDGDGKRIVSFDLGKNLDDRATGVATDGFNRVVLGGYARTADGGYDFAAARLSSSGALDASFDTDGRRTVRFNNGGGRDDRATGVAVDASNKIVLGGYAEQGTTGDYDFAAVRLRVSGSPDPTFGGDGEVTIAFDSINGGNDRASAIAIDVDGKIVLGGFAEQAVLGDFDFAVVRLNTNGSPDNTFGTQGKVTIAFDLGGTNSDIIRGIAVDVFGRVQAVGSAQRSSTNHDFAVISLTGN